MTTTTDDIAALFDRLETCTGWLASHWQELTDEQRILVLAKQEQIDRKLRELECRVMGRLLGLSLTERATLNQSR